MDPSVIFSEAAKLGFVVLLLLTAVYCLVRWILGLEAQRTARDAEARRECIEREQALAKRLTTIEDRSSQENAELLRRSTNAIEKFATALEKLTDGDSGLHLALIDHRERNT